MNQELIHVYFMPGMAASSSIFEYIKLPESQYKIHLLDWILPTKDESIVSYAERMSEKIEHSNSVLLGVSFGGILVQEMSKFLKLKKLIIVSSVKSHAELPKRMKILRATRAYHLIPTRLAKNVDALAKYAFGKTITRRIELYKKYLSMNNKQYLDWAIKEMICWQKTEIEHEVIHIHGDKDAVFPISHIKNCIIVKNGTHIMIINKYKWFNENLPSLIMR
ncbi:MAG: alpha/beta hydrolase [Bacteroidia bacterium]|nr:alpha/beta hydrolase [Bacteroidia bacterium]NND25069.1 alpha/beta hydrolase [Flavobacteriaceae bacterium]MBT8279407.1 alpha/beta hydrolase [Bacteroidia bacterium]NNK59377.1 alpha/beta hydrolase [Flavobacteriaceae bacterium]NNL33815.1 alpha/beta hydrolase [Flavobacteriaceae bacterium]